MTDIKPGDYVRIAFEGRVVERYKIVDDWVRVKAEGMGIFSAKIAHCTVINPPVKVGDEISYEQAIMLPNGSVTLGLAWATGPFAVSEGALWFGTEQKPSSFLMQNQTFRVLHIPIEATS